MTIAVHNTIDHAILPYIINSPILTDYGDWRFEGPLTIEQAKNTLANGFISAVGHAATAQFLGQLLGIGIPENRIQIKMNKGDQAIVFRLNIRMEEGRLLQADELATIPYEIGLLTRLN